MHGLLLLAEMVWITADQSHINLDFSPVRMLTMWLLRTSYIATTPQYTVVVPYSESDHENNRSTLPTYV